MTTLPNKRYGGHHEATETGWPKDTWKRDVEKYTSTRAYFKYTWRKTEAAAQDRAGWRQDKSVTLLTYAMFHCGWGKFWPP